MLCCIGLTSISISAFSQTYISAPVTAPLAAGSYYSNTSITLSPGFSFTASSGQSLQLYIGPSDCAQLTTTPSSNKNYIMITVPRIGGITTSAGLVNRSACDLMQSIQYFDGLGRPEQNVQVQGSPMNHDVVQPLAYDQLGREAFKYLPYTANSGNGSFESDALTTGAGVFNFYNPTGSGVSGTQQSNSVVVDPSPFALTNFEPSPLSRVIEQGAPGTDWQPIQGSSLGHTQKLDYRGNNTTAVTDTQNCYSAVLYKATISGNGTRTLINSGNYAFGQLSITISKNENWKSGRGGTTEEYRDFDGHVVLKRTFNYVGGILQFLSTYYIYDNFGNLCFVLPPGATPDVGLTSASNQTTLDNLCYQYGYDERNRLTQKRMPGEAWVYMVYNKLDQIVLSQDGNQHNINQWTVTKYDAQGREIVSGLWNDTSVPALSLATLQSNIYNAVQWDARDYTNNTTSNPTGYSISSYPSLTKVLKINYYDDYTAPNLPSKYIAPTGAITNASGMLTVTRTTVLNTVGNSSPDMLWATHYYDAMGKTIQVYSQNYLGGTTYLNPNYNYDIISNGYDFANELLTVTRSHYNYTNSGASAIVSIANTYVYDHIGRKKQISESINGSSSVLLEQNDYNELGQLVTHHLHSENGVAPFLQDVPYAYNERGWIASAGSSGNLYSYTLKYNTPDAGISKQYNGNISEMLYIGATSGSRTFSYVYDQLNRLTTATSTGNLYNEQLSYDFMGNISSLTRTGGNAATLVYTYANSGQSNQLQTVTNGGSAYRSYGYDNNGNATSDGLGRTITYNLLNLPSNVSQQNNSNSTLATYTYDASGNKLKNSGSDGYWDYVDGIVYKGSTATNGTIQFIQTPVGRAVPNGTAYRFEYNLTDHLGNVRASFDKNPSTGTVREIQEDEYYSFGLRKNQYDYSNNNRYLYNGKEVQTDLANQYDYGARFYDPVVARWTTPDPLRESAYVLTPYRYAFNNPTRVIDKNGNYEEDGHYWTVYLAVTLLGEKGAAKNWADAAEWPDHAFIPTYYMPTLQQDYHALTGNSSAYETQKSEGMIQDADNLHDLGIALHRYGDSYSHRRLGNESVMYGGSFFTTEHWYPDRGRPDEISLRPGLYMLYVKNLIRILEDRFDVNRKVDLFTFEYISNPKNHTDHYANEAIFSVEIGIQNYSKAFNINTKYLDEVTRYLKGRNEHYESDYKIIKVETTEIIRAPNGGGWVAVPGFRYMVVDGQGN